MALTKQQREERRHRLGGSDWGAILGLPGAYGTRLDVWRSKVEPAEEEESTYAQARGDALEPFVATWFGRERGLPVTLNPAGLPTDSAMPVWWRCQLDASVLEGAHIIPLEAKTATRFKRDEWGDSGSDQIPLRYVVQCMAQIAARGVPYGYLAVDIGGDEFRWYRVDRDDQLIAHMLAKGTEFWALVESGTPPPPSSSAEANLVWRTHEPGEYLEATPDLLTAAKRINAIKAAEKELEAEREALELRIKSALEFREGIRAGDQVLCTWKTQEAERLDVKGLRKEQPGIAAKYLKTTTTRVLRVKDLSDE